METDSVDALLRQCARCNDAQRAEPLLEEVRDERVQPGSAKRVTTSWHFRDNVKPRMLETSLCVGAVCASIEEETALNDCRQEHVGRPGGGQHRNAGELLQGGQQPLQPATVAIFSCVAVSMNVYCYAIWPQQKPNNADSEFTHDQSLTKSLPLMSMRLQHMEFCPVVLYLRLQ